MATFAPLASYLAGILAVAGSALAGPALHPETPMLAGKAVAAADPTHCLGLAGRPDIRIATGALRSGEGNVRFVLYGDKPEEFLEKGKRILRIEVPAREDGVSVCLSAPKPGTYALAVLHDINGNRKFNLTTDGGGFSNNPRFVIMAPSHAEAAFEAPATGVSLNVDIHYLVEKKKPGPQFRRR